MFFAPILIQSFYMEKLKNFNKKYIAIISVVLLLIVILLLSSQKGDSVINLNIPSPLGKGMKSTLDSQILLDKTKIDASFIPVSNKDLILEEVLNVDPSILQDTNNRIESNEIKASSFDGSSSLSDRLNTYFILSADYKTIGKYGKSKEMIEKALEIDPRNSSLLQVYSSLLNSMGDKDSALLYINKAIALYPNEASYWLWKIDLEKARKVDNDKLDQLYNLALDETSRNQSVLIMYARFLEEIGNKAEAMALWEKAKISDPKNSTMYDLEISRLK